MPVAILVRLNSYIGEDTTNQIWESHDDWLAPSFPLYWPGLHNYQSWRALR